MNVENKLKHQCSGCSACANVCPQKCITMVPDSEGYLYPKLDKDKCVNCRLCQKVCSFGNTEINKSSLMILGAYSCNDDERQLSSSGGVFSLLARDVIDQDGIVFGMSMSSNCKSAYNIGVEDIEELSVLRGSKYFQGEIGSSFLEAKKYLDEDRKVLFSGTPCQIAGLYGFLGKEYPNLLTVDLVCHGTPSQLLWEKYIENEVSKHNKSVESINFRSKRISWEKFGLEIKFTDGSSSFEDLSKNTFLQMFLNNFCLRPSCYSCTSKCVADITLGDLWGGRDMFPQIFEERGTSLILINSSNGRNYFDRIKPNLKYASVDYENVLKTNPCVEKSVSKPKQRESFYFDLSEMSYDKFEKKYMSLIRSNKNKKTRTSMLYYLKRGLIKVRNIFK